MVLAAAPILQPAQIKQHPSCSALSGSPLLPSRKWPKTGRSIVPVARLFGPAIFEASKLKVLHVGVDEEKHPGSLCLSLPRAYTLTHSDITSKITLAISNTINRAQVPIYYLLVISLPTDPSNKDFLGWLQKLKGWCNRVQRDEVVAEWKKIQGNMSLHVHCHISGGHFLLDLLANLRYYVFCKELPVVLKAFAYGDRKLFDGYPELDEAQVWVYFHSGIPKFNRVECWGTLQDAASGRHRIRDPGPSDEPSSPAEQPWVWPQRCQTECNCCFPPESLIPWPKNFQEDLGAAQYQRQ